MAETYIERRKRGFFGWIFLLTFFAFNALMVLWLGSYWGVVGEAITEGQSEAARAGATIGGTIGTGVILFTWACGSVILGLLVMMTRGKKIIERCA